MPSKEGHFQRKPSAPISTYVPELEQAIREEAKRLRTILEQAGAS